MIAIRPVGGRLAGDQRKGRPQGGLLQWLFVALVSTAAQADYQAGLDAYNAGDYATALAEWKAEVGKPGEPVNPAVYREALYAIAMLYWKGEGVLQDYSLAAAWLKQAADMNHAGAQNKIGFLYANGEGVPQNYQQARMWFQLAAEQGNQEAVDNLAILNDRGLGWPEDPGPGFGLLAQSDPARLRQTYGADRPGPAPRPESTADAGPGAAPETAPMPTPATATEAAGAMDVASVSEAVPEPRLAGVSETAITPGPEPAPAPAKIAVPLTEAAPVTEAVTEAEVAPVTNSAPGKALGSGWIRAQNPEHYTIQVIALRTTEKLEAFIAAHPDWAPFALYHPADNPQPLWVLVQGAYPDVASARAAAARFPGRLQKREALWIRRFRMVQKALE